MATSGGDVLHSYYNCGPTSIDLIDKNLYLGNLSAAKNVATLSKYKIDYILTIDTCPLPRHILDLKHIKKMYIQLSDLPNEDLLSHLDDTYAFIEDGINNGVVLVHCVVGVSRSATVIIAYLMKKYNLTNSEAIRRVELKRRVICPNPGFLSQLRLYKEMGCKIDKSNNKYKRFRLSCAANIVRKVKILPQDYFDLIKPDPGLTRTQPEPNGYRCKKCRRMLASESSLMKHEDKSTKIICNKTYFVEPLSWMKHITQTTQGKLHCPKCNSKVGSFSWIMGCQCPCGCQIAPAFYLTPSKVDWANVVKNVEVTI